MFETCYEKQEIFTTSDHYSGENRGKARSRVDAKHHGSKTCGNGSGKVQRPY